MKYTAKGEQNRHFELQDENSNALGMVEYRHWFSTEVDIKQGGNTYNIKPSNFWHTSLHVLQNETIVADMKFNWAGNMIIKFGDDTYTFKPAFWHNKYTLFTEHEQGIITLQPDFQWNKFSFNYKIETDDNYAAGKNALLLLILIYCCNHLHTRTHVAM